LSRPIESRPYFTLKLRIGASADGQRAEQRNGRRVQYAGGTVLHCASLASVSDRLHGWLHGDRVNPRLTDLRGRQWNVPATYRVSAGGRDGGGCGMEMG